MTRITGKNDAFAAATIRAANALDELMSALAGLANGFAEVHGRNAAEVDVIHPAAVLRINCLNLLTDATGIEMGGEVHTPELAPFAQFGPAKAAVQADL